jgi:hypothetical protein
MFFGLSLTGLDLAYKGQTEEKTWSQQEWKFAFHILTSYI